MPHYKVPYVELFVKIKLPSSLCYIHREIIVSIALFPTFPYTMVNEDSFFLKGRAIYKAAYGIVHLTVTYAQYGQKIYYKAAY